MSWTCAFSLGFKGLPCPGYHGRRLAAAYGPAARTLFVPAAGHVRSYTTDPAAYLTHVLPVLAGAPS